MRIRCSAFVGAGEGNDVADKDLEQNGAEGTRIRRALQALQPGQPIAPLSIAACLTYCVLEVGASIQAERTARLEHRLAGCVPGEILDGPS